MRVKIEINTREHFAVHGAVKRPFNLESPWLSGSTQIHTYSLSELLGTKLRALYQRKKGRDLFDLWLGLQNDEANPVKVVYAFNAYMKHGNTPVTRAQFEANMEKKLNDVAFLNDLSPLLRTGTAYNASQAWGQIHEALITKLQGEPWKGTNS